MRWPRYHLLVACALFGALACNREPTDPVPVANGTYYYSRLVLNHHAITLSTTVPYDTVQLLATPYNAIGGRPPGVSIIEYVKADTTDSTFTLTESGLVTAKHPVHDVRVIARARDSLFNVTRADTAYLNITADAPSIATFSIQPAPGDSAKVSMSGVLCRNSVDPCIQPSLNLRILDASGIPIPEIAVAFSTSDSLTAYTDTVGNIRPVVQGEVTFYVTAHAYGKTFRDSLHYSIGYPIFVLVTPIVDSRTPSHYSLYPLVDSVGVGASISWLNYSFTFQDFGPPFDITFDDPSVALTDSANVLGFDMPTTGPGNIPAFSVDSTLLSAQTNEEYLRLAESYLRTRKFVRPGTYPYRSELYGIQGAIVVIPE